ncbi:Membrane-associated protein [Plasmodiophora brassicae]
MTSARRVAFLVLIVVLTNLASADHDDLSSLRADVEALRQRVDMLEKATQIVGSSGPLQRLSQTTVDNDILAIRSIFVPVAGRPYPARMTLVVTSAPALLLLNDDGTTCASVELAPPQQCTPVRAAIDFAQGDEHLVVVALCAILQTMTLSVYASGSNIVASLLHDAVVVSPSPVTSVAVQNFRYLQQFATGDVDGVVRVYTRNGTERISVPISSDPIINVVINARPRFVTYATASTVGFVRAFGGEPGAEQCTLDDTDDRITSVSHDARHPTLVYVGTSMSKVVVFDIDGDRRSRNSCRQRWVVPLDVPGGVIAKSVGRYVLAVTHDTLILLNGTNIERVRPPLSSRLDVGGQMMSAVQDGTHHAMVSIVTGTNTVQVFAGDMADGPSSSSSSFSFQKLPIAAIVTVGVIVYQLAKKNRSTTGDASGELSDADRRMIESLIRKGGDARHDDFVPRGLSPAARRHHGISISPPLRHRRRVVQREDIPDDDDDGECNDVDALEGLLSSKDR